MIIISKKRIQIIILCLIISVFAFTLQISDKKEKIVENTNTVQTTATPISGKTIIVDAGHGTPDERSRK